MPTGKEYMDYILDCLSEVDGISTRQMMGEYREPLKTQFERKRAIHAVYCVKPPNRAPARLRRLSLYPTQLSHFLFSKRFLEVPYIVYCREKVIGGVYDNRLLIKPTASAKRLLPDARYELPYEGAKEMLLVEDTDNRAFLAELVNAVADDLPAPKKRK